ncbi:MAG: DUF4349 domain-containing protein [Victivallaceae bacterium]|nr:DUF4349 domain-containing protein [Victivallaceae bacterium]
MFKISCVMVLAAAMLAGCVSDEQSYGMPPSPKIQAEECADFGAACGMTFAPASAANTAHMAAKGRTVAGMAENGPSADTIKVTEGRKMIFSARYELMVVSVNDAQEQTEKLTAKFGGYVQQLDSRMMIVRIPVDMASGFLNAISGIGEVVDRSITGQDVTEEMTDIKIRLDNLEVLRKRLQKLAESSGKVEDLLKVERELARVTSEIEQLEGRMKFLTNRVDLVTVTLLFNQRVVTAPQQSEVPVEWVAMLGSGVGGAPAEPMSGGSQVFDVELPENFAVIRNQRNATWAVSADEGVILLSCHRDLENASDAFWRAMIERALKNAGFAEITTQVFTTPEGFEATLVNGKREIFNRVWIYQIVFVRYWDTVYSYECWAPENVFNSVKPLLDTSYQTIDLSIWR